MEPLRSINDLFMRAGGSVKLAALVNVNQWTVDRWVKTGIPVKHWALIIKTFGGSIEDMYNISEKARRLAEKE